MGENGHQLSHTGEKWLRVEHLGPDPDLGVILWRSKPHRSSQASVFMVCRRPAPGKQSCRQEALSGRGLLTIRLSPGSVPRGVHINVDKAVLSPCWAHLIGTRDNPSLRPASLRCRAREVWHPAIPGSARFALLLARHTPGQADRRLTGATGKRRQ